MGGSLTGLTWDSMIGGLSIERGDRIVYIASKEQRHIDQPIKAYIW
jgi:hypothetical protein